MIYQSITNLFVILQTLSLKKDWDCIFDNLGKEQVTINNLSKANQQFQKKKQGHLLTFQSNLSLEDYKKGTCFIPILLIIILLDFRNQINRVFKSSIS